MGNTSSDNSILEDFSDQAILQIKGESGALLGDIAAFFADLEYVYGSIGYFFFITDLDNVLIRYRPSRFWFYGGHFPPKDLFVREADIRLYSANFNSPGIWEFLAKINPFEVIRLMINDYYERRSNQHLIPYERRKRELENLILENQVIRERVQILRDIGLEQPQIEAIIRDTVMRPASRLVAHQESGLIQTASIRRLGDAKK